MTRKAFLTNGKICRETLSAGMLLVHGEQNAQSRDQGVTSVLRQVSENRVQEKTGFLSGRPLQA